MSDYVVSAIKYRPGNFDDVVGQKALTSTLAEAIKSGKLAHSYLFCGPRGVGKTTCARIFAKTINCMNPRPDGEACDECDSCKAFNEGRSLNINELDAASNNSVDDIRELIDQVRIPPQMGKYKVFILDEVHMLSQAAANAFLKTLEEPPYYAIFILATTEKQKILPTILSRCQIYDFKRIEADDIVYQLKKIADKEGFSYEDEALRVIAEKADGGMRDALSMFDQQVVYTGGNITYQQVIRNLNILDYSAYFKIYDDILAHNVPQVLLDFNDITLRGFDGRDFIDGLARHARNLLMASDSRTAGLMQMSRQTAAKYAEQAQKCKAKTLYKVMKLCSDCSLNYRNSRNKQLLVEITLIEAAQADDDRDAHATAEKAEALKPIFSEQKQAQSAQAAEKPVNAFASPKPSATAAQPVHPVKAEAPVSAEPATGAKSIHLTSIRSIMQKTEEPQTDSVSDDRDAAYGSGAMPPGNPQSAPAAEKFSGSQLMAAWAEFASTLPTEYNDLAQRMHAMQPHADGDAHVTAECNNSFVLSSMQKLAPRLQTFLREKLQNAGIQVEFKIPEKFVGGDVSPVLNDAEEFKKYVSSDEMLSKLNEALNFEII